MAKAKDQEFWRYKELFEKNKWPRKGYNNKLGKWKKSTKQLRQQWQCPVKLKLFMLSKLSIKLLNVLIKNSNLKLWLLKEFKTFRERISNNIVKTILTQKHDSNT